MKTRHAKTENMMSKPRSPILLCIACAALVAHAAWAAGPTAVASAPQPAAPGAAAPASLPAATPAPNAPAPATAADNGTVRALIVADMEAVISSQIAGRITSMPRQVGDTFSTGDLLVGFDCQDRAANVKAAQAELLGARESHLAKMKLQSLGAVSDLDVTLAAAAAEKAKSQLALAQVQEKYCVVAAPYPGKVVRVRAKAFESVQVSQPLLEIVNLASLRAQMFVPSSWVRWMKPGKAFTVAVDETGQSYTARVYRVSGRIDGASQTVEVIAKFDKVPANLLPGMIGKATFPEAK
ncbi:efflux RND transporter periplasmic adaptor subunit [Ramlibacter humi]|uniref:Efflux RND transporter periplasmic adaptor subunit n=1 Tax=Ramlibacter humi TaxID=2530451 RepID=A0A4Z0BYH9_9BURK|nr:efflux RND transporter periplasmic adaptor subunit [Ramlibacter humi]TFZ03574.1 efflux RND transporter periplasmic adaptor subunit [Ramlibacter humi]